MTLGYKLSKLRKENNYTQEQLADVLGVSRQAISKWESDAAYPETDKLIRISELFDCSLDYLLKEQIESETENKSATNYYKPTFQKIFCERKSSKTLWGMPLYHIGKNAKAVIAIGLNANGIIAVGLKSKGIISMGLLSIGLLSFGTLSLGLLSSGLFSIGILSAGCFSMGILSAGAISLGIISVGGIAIGDFSVGGAAIGKYFALGGNAKAMIAISDNHATGSIYSKIGELSPQDVSNIKELLDANTPKYLAWAKEIIKMFL